MKIHLIKEKTIRNFVLGNARNKVSFEDWLAKIRVADWLVPEDIKATYHSADLLGRGSNRVIFNIGGNNYRMICKYVFGDNEVHLFICWIGTHVAYDKLCKSGDQYSVNIY